MGLRNFTAGPCGLVMILGCVKNVLKSLSGTSVGPFFPTLHVPLSASGTQLDLILMQRSAFVFTELEDPVTVPTTSCLCRGESYLSIITLSTIHISLEHADSDS